MDKHNERKQSKQTSFPPTLGKKETLFHSFILLFHSLVLQRLVIKFYDKQSWVPNERMEGSSTLARAELEKTQHTWNLFLFAPLNKSLQNYLTRAFLFFSSWGIIFNKSPGLAADSAVFVSGDGVICGLSGAF